jgi:hypothetical protein
MFLLFSCKKDNKSPNHATKLYPITFNISGFTVTNTPTDAAGKLKSTALATQAADSIPVNRLVYWLLDPKQSISYSVRVSNKGEAGFGTFTDNVAPGNYIIAFAGSSANLKFDGPNYFFTFAPVPTYVGHPSYWEETYFKTIPITVTSSGVNMDVSLSRITAKLDLVIKDPIPVGTSKIVVSFPDTATVMVKTGLGNGITTNGATKTISATDIGKTNYTISMNTLNNIKPFDVVVTYYGPDPSGPLGTKTIKNVVCKANTKTTLSGNLFDAGNAAFTITVNQDWNTATVDF